MIPPRQVPPGNLKLYEVKEGERTLVMETSNSPYDRIKVNEMRNSLLMRDSRKELIIVENNAI